MGSVFEEYCAPSTDDRALIESTSLTLTA